MPIFDWKILKQEKEILGYTCQKATLSYKGRDYVAWFSLQIPIQNGPWKFGGLPGLIFEISDTQNHYAFELIGIKKEIDTFPKTYQKPIEIRKKDYKMAVENILKSLENKLMGDSKLRFKRQRIASKKKAKPNPIELEE
jgi:GLPGLI family protein